MGGGGRSDGNGDSDGSGGGNGGGGGGRRSGSVKSGAGGCGRCWRRRRWLYPDPAPIATTASDSAMADWVGSSKAYLKMGSAKMEPPPPSNPSKPPTASPRLAPAGLAGVIGGAAASMIGSASTISSASLGAAARRLTATAGTRRWWQTRAGRGAIWRATSAIQSRPMPIVNWKTPRPGGVDAKVCVTAPTDRFQNGFSFNGFDVPAHLQRRSAAGPRGKGARGVGGTAAENSTATAVRCDVRTVAM